VNRRELVAGLASVGVLGGAGAVASGAVPVGPLSTGEAGGESDDDSSASGGDSDSRTPVDPVTLQTINVPGSRDGEMTLPAPDRPTFIDFFATWCGPCEEQMPALAAAHEQIGDDVLFVSVTTQPVGEVVAPETVADWWRKNDGDWLVAADISAELAARLGVSNYPSARAIDASGRVRWATSGTHTTDEFVAGIENALGR
jgi:thiol-disulfide isomerase/thioredoxin